jgi:hypothetical protein
MSFYVLVSTIVSTIVITTYHKALGQVFATLTIPSYCPVYEHVEAFLSHAYAGRQMEMDTESRITIARNATSWFWYHGSLVGVSCQVEDAGRMERNRLIYMWALRRSTLEHFVTAQRMQHGLTDVVKVGTCGAYNWHVTTYPMRSISSILAPAPIAAMLDDARQFAMAKQRYADLGIPYRRGYLLIGPPGTGKSSCALGLAGALNRQLCFLSLTGKHANDTWLLDMITSAPLGSVVLIDDFDRFTPSSTGVTVAGLLNALDGVVAQTGKIVVLVANDITKIPDAILRPGRIDRQFVFELTETQDATALFERFHGATHAGEFAANFPGPRSAAAIVSHLMRYDSALAAATHAAEI